MRVARVSNLASTIDELKEKGCWVYGADMDGTDYKKTDFSGAVVLVIAPRQGHRQAYKAKVRRHCLFADERQYKFT